MVEIKINNTIDGGKFMNSTPEEVEKYLNNMIVDDIAKGIHEKIQEVSFIEMEFDEGKNEFYVHGELVLMAMADMGTKMQIMSTKMREMDLDNEEIEDILSVLLENTQGF